MHDVLVRFLTALFQGMDYAAEENHEQVAQWVADELKVEYEDSYGETTSGEWMTGKEVYEGVKDGTVQGYYEFQQELDDSQTRQHYHRGPSPSRTTSPLTIITEVGEALYGEAAAE